MEGEVKEGESFELTLQIDRNPATTRRVGSEKVDVSKEALTVMLSMGAGSTADASDYEIMTNPVEVPEHNGTAPWVQEVSVAVMARADDEIDDMEMLVLDAEVDGTENATSGDNTDDDSYAGVSILTIGEGTERLVWAKSMDEVTDVIYAAKMEAMPDMDGNIAPGASFMFSAIALFNYAEGVTLEFAASSDDETAVSAAVDDGMVVVTGKMDGMAHVTLTATATSPSGVMIVEQTVPNVAQVLFPVSVMMPVPALPVIAQLLLMAFLAIGGGYRRYLRR